MMLSQRIRPHRQVEAMLLIKLTQPLVIANIDRLIYLLREHLYCVIFFSYEVFFYYFCKVILANYLVDFNKLIFYEFSYLFWINRI